MVRCARFVGFVSLAVSLCWLFVPPHSALAVDTTSNLRLSPTMAQLAPSDARRCQRAAGGACCAAFAGATLCTPAPVSGFCPRGSSCCSEKQRTSGKCILTVAPQPVCPFIEVGETCCTPTNVPISCTTRAPGGLCGSSEVALDFRGVSACCKAADTSRTCTPAPSAVPPPGSQPRPESDNSICTIPILNLLCPPPFAGQCERDSDCPSGMSCHPQDRVCIDQGQLQRRRETK